MKKMKGIVVYVKNIMIIKISIVTNVILLIIIGKNIVVDANKFIVL